jgi:hypothetical protein
MVRGQPKQKVSENPSHVNKKARLGGALFVGDAWWCSGGDL